MSPAGFFPPNGYLSKWIADQFEPGYQGWAVDVGAADGISINTTFKLERTYRWTVLSVEANPECEAMLKEWRARFELCACAAAPAESATFHVNTENPDAFSALHPISPDEIAKLHQGRVVWKDITVRVETVDRLLAKWQFPKLDALCVDVEGGELEVLKGCDLVRWKPRVLVIESWQDHAPALNDYLAERGYQQVGRNVHNSLYLDQSVIPEKAEA